MIFGLISDLERYRGVHPHFLTVIDFLNAKSIQDRPDGRYDVNSEGAFVGVETYHTKNPEDCFIECHRKYIDIQLILSGEEQMGVRHREQCESLAYSEELEFQKLLGDVDFLKFREGSFMIFFPEDGHMPKVNPSGAFGVEVRKAVFKLPVGF